MVAPDGPASRAPRTSRGGAVVGAGAISILDSLFESNNASGQPSGFDSGGAIYMTPGGTLVVERSRFERNRVIGTAGEQYGGAIHFASYGNLEIDASSFAANTAGYSGGAVMALFSKQVLITDSTFDGNTTGPGLRDREPVGRSRSWVLATAPTAGSSTTAATTSIRSSARASTTRYPASPYGTPL